jgi:anti-sigma regulatory factor (Ser/Thr protein kinase)
MSDCVPEDAVSREQNGGSFRMVLPSSAVELASARRKFAAFARLCGFEGEAAADLTLAVGEAMANAVKHGFRSDSEIMVSARVAGGAIDVLVSDEGPGFKPGPRPVSPTAGGSLRGFGIYLMYELMDRVEFSDGGTSVRLVKMLPPRRFH